MEQSLLETLSLHTSPPSLLNLAAARSLLLNPASSSATFRSLTSALLRSLNHPTPTPTPTPTYLRHVIRLLADAAALHPHLAPTVLAAIRPLLSSGNRLAADALAALSSIGDTSLDQDLIVSLASSPVVSVRSRLLGLLIADPILPRRHLNFMICVFARLTADLYPLVRKAALEGLVELCKDGGVGLDGEMAECCYDRAVELLLDEEESVRFTAVRLVSECGQLFSSDDEKINRSEHMDMIFLQLCSMARDMSLKVRVEAFIAIGKVRLVSESVLAQSLSKKLSWNKSEKNVLAKSSLQESKSKLPCAAGVFVHGIEDEFYEVRMAACKSLGMLAFSSLKFADDGLNLLMDMLNDDATTVRLQTLQTLFSMAASDRLTMQEKHLHMFLGLLADVSAPIRSAARKVLQLMRLPERKIFKSAIDGLITNLETYPEEEEDIFLVIFFIGKNHGRVAAKLAKKFVKKLNLSSDGELSLDSPRVAALLVLAISSPFSDKQLACDIPSSVFSYAIPLLGKISSSLGHIINPDSLLAYLFYHGGMLVSARKSLREAEVLPLTDEQVISNFRKWPDELCCSSLLINKKSSEIKFNKNMLELSTISTPLEQIHRKVDMVYEEKLQSLKAILKTATGTWQLIQSNCTSEVQRILRVCMEELEMIAWNADSFVSAILAFASQYVLVTKLFAKIWEQVKPKRYCIIGMVSLDLLLERVSTSLRRMRYGFRGLSREEECHILEVTLCAYVLRTYKAGTCSDLILKMLLDTLSRLEHLNENDSLSDFVKELRRICNEERVNGSARHFPVRKLLDLFNIEHMQFTGGLRQIRAELQAIGNDSEKPLPFVSGLPVGITFQVTLYNISECDRLWVQMVTSESVEYAFLDLCQFGGSSEVRKGIVNFPFYAAPRTTSFILKSCISMECPLADVTCMKKGQGGPKYSIIPLCEEIDVYLARFENG